MHSVLLKDIFPSSTQTIEEDIQSILTMSFSLNTPYFFSKQFLTEFSCELFRFFMKQVCLSPKGQTLPNTKSIKPFIQKLQGLVFWQKTTIPLSYVLFRCREALLVIFCDIFVLTYYPDLRFFTQEQTYFRSVLNFYFPNTTLLLNSLSLF